MIRVDDDGNSIVRIRDTDTTYKRRGIISLVVLILVSFSSKEISSSVGSLDDDGGVVFRGSLHEGIGSRGTGNQPVGTCYGFPNYPVNSQKFRRTTKSQYYIGE